MAARSDNVIETELEYGPREPVCVRVTRRDYRISVTDEGAALAKAGRPDGWREIAERLGAAADVNISRSGAVCLPVVPVGPPEEVVVRRIAEASLDLYNELLDLET
jgi:hypothetical protein